MVKKFFLQYWKFMAILPFAVLSFKAQLKITNHYQNPHIVSNEKNYGQCSRGNS